MKGKLIFDKIFNVREIEYHAPYGTLVCYDGCAGDFSIVDNKHGETYILSEDFPYLSFCGNIIDGTERPENVVKFIFCHFGYDTSIDDIKEQINDFKKTI